VICMLSLHVNADMFGFVNHGFSMTVVDYVCGELEFSTGPSLSSDERS